MSPTRRRTFRCAIAAHEVTISLRHGGGFQEPPHAYVRCDQRDCQYADLNRPPCPLNTAMFDDGSDERVTTYLQAHSGARFCYGCLTTELAMDHDQVRRASWHLKEAPGVSIRPTRCSGCHRRGVTIGLSRRDGAASPQPIARPEPRDDRRGVVAFLADVSGAAFCAGCVALSTGLGLAEARRILEDFEQRDGICSACHRRQMLVRMRGDDG